VILKQLETATSVRIRCPNCGDDFAAREAQLFDATAPRLPSHAISAINAWRKELAIGRAEIRKRELLASQRALTAARSGRIGKVVEKLAPALEGFDFVTGDCRALFEPIDYVVFQGLVKASDIEAVQFVDVKSGSATLSSSQRTIRDVIRDGNVRLEIANDL
jgi:predicted Holliday junction resolvase-like endonuclease